MSGIRLTWRGPQAMAATREGAQRGLTMAANHLLSESRKQVPVRESILRGTGAVTVVTPRKVAVSYDTPYAVRQHEELGYHHPKQGKAKYLEDPLHSESDTMLEMVAAQIRRSLG